MRLIGWLGYTQFTAEDAENAEERSIRLGEANLYGVVQKDFFDGCAVASPILLKIHFCNRFWLAASPFHRVPSLFYTLLE